MKITVIFGSHRLGGTNGEIETMLKGLSTNYEFEFLHMADYEVKGCISCQRCAECRYCILPPSKSDCFQDIFDKLIATDIILIVTPVYASIPSRLTALFERITSILFYTGLMNSERNPLLNKKVGIFNYCSNKICDDKSLKIIFQKFVMKDYSFEDISYNFLNDCDNPNERYENILMYIKDIVINL